MEYHRELIDRATGRLETTSTGDWITVTELGQKYGAGSKTTRLVLHHMGVLAQEKGRYRLPRWQLDAGVGLRHDRPKSGYAFDVISPRGQQLIAEAWADAAREYEAECSRDGDILRTRASLDTFTRSRGAPLDTRQQVYWVLDHFPDVQHRTIASALEVSPALVSRYAAERGERLQGLRRRKVAELDAPEASPAKRHLKALQRAAQGGSLKCSETEST